MSAILDCLAAAFRRKPPAVVKADARKNTTRFSDLPYEVLAIEYRGARWLHDNDPDAANDQRFVFNGDEDYGKVWFANTMPLSLDDTLLILRGDTWDLVEVTGPKTGFILRKIEKDSYEVAKYTLR